MSGQAGHLKFDELEQWVFSAVVADALDVVGLRHQAMAGRLRPLDRSRRLVGRARTLLVEPVDSVPKEPYGNLLQALDETVPGEVIVASVTAPSNCALWGGLLSTAARAAGARGAIIDGRTRDADEILRLDFPTFVAGFSPTDSLGRIDVTAVNRPLMCGGVEVSPGDLVVGDVDGIVVVPPEVEEFVLSHSRSKASEENQVRTALAGGMRASDAFARFGIL